MTPARYQNCSLGYPQGEQRTESKEERQQRVGRREMGPGLAFVGHPFPSWEDPAFLCVFGSRRSSDPSASAQASDVNQTSSRQAGS